MHRVGGKAETARHNFHAAAGGLAKQFSVARISTVAGSKVVHIWAAEAGHEHRASFRKHTHELDQMLLAPLGHRVRE